MSLPDQLPCGLLVAREDGTVEWVNETLLALLGRERAQVEGRLLESILPLAARIFYQTHLFPLLRLQQRVEEVYLSLRASDGSTVPLLVNAQSVNEDGQVRYHYVLMPMRQRNRYEDELLKAKRAAEEALRVKDEFLAVVSHELRTPLSAMLGWAQLLQQGRVPAQEHARALAAIERNARIQARLVEDLLDFSRITTGKLRLDVTTVQPIDVLEAALDVVRPAAEAKGVRLQPLLDPNAGPVSGDADRLQQVFWNLLSNAVKFTPRGGRVQVRMERAESAVQVVVSDTGQGIAPEFLPFVFERFRQAEDSSVRAQGGLGLGLSISRYLVELHGGTITAASEGPGCGASFCVRLPLMILRTDRLQPVEARPAAVGNRLEHLNVLIVEDEREARELLVAVLEESGARVTVVPDAAAAFKHVQEASPHVIVCDITMPGEDGYSLLRRIRDWERDRNHRIPAIALTAQTRSTDRVLALAAGFQMHLSKPVAPYELVLAIANLAAHAGTEGQASVTGNAPAKG